MKIIKKGFIIIILILTIIKSINHTQSVKLYKQNPLILNNWYNNQSSNLNSKVNGDCDQICFNLMKISRTDCPRGIYAKTANENGNLECICTSNENVKKGFIQNDYCYTPTICKVKSIYKNCKE